MSIQPLSSQPRLINNRYELIKKLGQGGMGTVYQAFDRVNQETVALKQVRISMIPVETDTDNERNKMNRLALTSEFQQLASLHHPNIVRVLDYGWDETTAPFFTMTYLENTKTVLDASKNATNEQRLEYFIQLIQALMYLHRRGIVHRDLKPDNLLVMPDNTMKIVDFGIASAEHDSREGVLGTLLYMPPEVVKNQAGQVEILRTSDLYAAGLVAYEMFTGIYPYDRSNVKKLLRDIIKTYPDLSLLPKAGTGDKNVNTRMPLETVVGRLLSKEANFRYQDAADVLEDLSKVVGKEAISESTAIRESFLQAATFVGRRTERKALLTQLKQLRDNRLGSGFLIGGESGVGKSRLIEEIRVQALVQGIMVLRGQPTNNVGLPFQMWREIVRRLVIVTEISDKHASFLRSIVPDIADLLQRDIPDAPKLTGDVARKSLINAILSLFAKQETPVLLLLEDLHWVNDSLDVLHELTQYIKQLPIMILGSYRSDERADLPESLPLMHAVKLQRLSDDEIAELSASMLGTGGRRPEVVDLLQRETEGNVFFVIEVVRALAEEAGNLEKIGSATLPQHVFAGGIQTILRRRLEMVTLKDYDMLKRAAVYGRFIDLEIIRTVLEGHQHPLKMWLSDCANASVLEQYDGEWRFTHDKLREHIINQLDDDELKQLSRELALVVESLHGEDTSWFEVLTSLWHDADDFEKEVTYMRVFLRELAQYSYDYTRIQDYALYALDRLPEDDVRCVDFLNPLSQISGHGGEYQAGYEYAMRANELAKQHDYQIGLAYSYNNLGNTAYYLGHYQASIIYYRHSAEIHEALENQFDWALNLHNLAWVYPYIGEYENAWDFVEQGQAIFIEMDHKWGIAGGYFIMALIASHEGDYSEAIELHYKSLDIYEGQEDLWGIVLNFNNLGFIFLRLGEIEQAQESFHQCLTLTYQTHLMSSLLEALVGIAHIYAEHDQGKQAGLLYGVVESHQARNSDVDRQLALLIQRLESDFSQDDIWKGIAQGRKRSLDDVVQKLLG